MMGKELTSKLSCPVAVLNMGQLLKERICSYRSKFFPLQVDHFRKILLSRYTNRKSQKLFPFAKKAEKKEDLPLPFKFL